MESNLVKKLLQTIGTSMVRNIKEINFIFQKFRTFEQEKLI
jgi:hypothetical protein